MISQADLTQFMIRVRQENTGNTGWTRRRSSLRFLLDAIESYNRDPSLVNFNAITAARNNIPGPKKTQYTQSLTYMDGVLAAEKNVASSQELVNRLANNKFRVTSGFDEYSSAFGNSFTSKLGNFGNKSRWLDGGSGEAKAMIEYLEDGGLGNCIATGYAVPGQARDSVSAAAKKFAGRFKYISGKYFGEIDDPELDWPGNGDFDLITDLNGVLYYTPTLVEDLTRYLELLAVGGLLMFTSVEARINAPNAAYDERKIPGLAKWAANIGGVNVQMLTRSFTLCYAITKTSAKIVVPAMTRDKYETGQQNAPTREYTCTLGLPNDPVVA